MVNNCLVFIINLLVFYVTWISFASVQHCFQIVPLCNVCYNSHDNNISKQVYMAVEFVLVFSTSM